MYKIGRIVLSIFIVSLIALACEGPSGPEGIQGSEGPEGPVGPAGEDGSLMYAGEGEPGNDIGDIDDYYLNQDTGELYGPKDEDGWGDPGVVLMGADGQDGEDGSQIHSGSGEPDPDLGAEGDFYLNEDEYDLYGPKTSNGWGSPLNLKGVDGNANVTRYIYPGYDFEQSSYQALQIPDIDSEEQMNENALLVYLIDADPDADSVHIQIPGYGWAFNTFYQVITAWDRESLFFSEPGVVCLIETEGPGEEFEGIEVFRIEASNTEAMTKQKGSIIPDHLDTSDYEAVADYYGFSN
ncbi:MAG: hypothetical protein WEA58_07945 [Balneolaceae bacterium]